MDREVYTTIGKPEYVIQFQTENGIWQDSNQFPKFRSEDEAIRCLEDNTALGYPYRVVERTPDA